MNTSFKKIILISLACVLVHGIVFSASIRLSAPEKTQANRKPIIVQVILDPENDTLSGIGGDFSFPTELFTFDGVDIEGSAVSLWVTQPSVSSERYLDARTHVTFEGIFPGGFDGVRSPYYSGRKPGVLFNVILIPKSDGVGALIVDNILLNAFTSDATPIKSKSTIQMITIPPLQGQVTSLNKIHQEVKSPTLTAVITRDKLVNNNAWYVLVNDSEAKVSIKYIYVAETDDWTARIVSNSAWQKVSNPYVLFYQQRDTFVHVKVVYTDNTYTLRTLVPVENSQHISSVSRILVCIAVVLLSVIILLYLHVQKKTTIINKKPQN